MLHLKSILLPFILFSLLLSENNATAKNAPDTTIYFVAEQPPSFPGGAHARNEFLATHLHYPDEALRNHVTGKVYVGFVVESDGNISHINVLKGIGFGCDKEAMQVVAQMPKWHPGLINGKPVRVRYTLPFTFNIHAPDREKVYTRVDVYPLFDVDNIGGIEGFIRQQLHYPVSIVKDHVTDTVNVFFVVKSNDSITHVSVRKDPAQLDAYDYEAMRVVRILPVLKPAVLDNEPVSVQLYVPVVFNYREVDTTTAKTFRATFDGKTFSYYRQGMVDVADTFPEFPGGVKALMQYLGVHLKYPDAAKRMHLQGKVFMQFIVERDGSITHIRVVRGVSPSLNAAAVKVIRDMPKWTPGFLHGKPIRMTFNLPIKFTME